MAYAQARNDFEYLESVADLDDWAELQGDLLVLMHTPTKVMATTFYKRAIGLWFSENAINQDGKMSKGVRKIYERYSA